MPNHLRVKAASVSDDHDIILNNEFIRYQSFFSNLPISLVSGKANGWLAVMVEKSVSLMRPM